MTNNLERAGKQQLGQEEKKSSESTLPNIDINTSNKDDLQRGINGDSKEIEDDSDVIKAFRLSPKCSIQFENKEKPCKYSKRTKKKEEKKE